MRHTWTIVLLLLAGVPAPVGSAAESAWRAGSAKIKITPARSMWMAGYGGRDRPSEGKLTELWAKALVLEDSEGHRAALVTLDLVGIGYDLSHSICARLEAEYGLDRSQVALCTSHTHTGPVVGRNLGPLHYLVVDPAEQKRIEEYADQLEKNVVSVVGDAIGKMGPSQLYWGSGRATYAVNRRNNRESEVPRLRAAGELQGPVDHDVPVLAVRDEQDRLKTVVFGYACHATVLSFYLWSGDHPGFAQMEFEKHHPGCLAMFFAGCGADINPLPRRTVELAQHYGRQLATAVEQVVMTWKMHPVEGTLRTAYREIDLDLGALPTREEIEQDARSTNKFRVARAKMLLDKLDSGKPLAASYPYPVSVWQIGDEIQFVVLGGEVVVDYAIRLKAELSGIKTWVAGYSNDVMAYIPSRRVLREGGYEGEGAMVYYGLPTAWSPEVENQIVQEVHAQLDKPGATSGGAER